MTSPNQPQPSFNDLIVLADIVDTIRNDERMIDHELGSDDRSKAAKVRLKEMYQAQGLEVSDAIIDEAMARRDAERYAYKPAVTGFSRALWLSYIRRTAYAIKSGAAIVVLGLGVVGWQGFQYQFVEKPRIEAAAKAAQEKKDREASLERSLTQVLPAALEAARGKALAVANRLGDEASKAEIEGLSRQAEGALAARDDNGAEDQIVKIEGIARDLSEIESRRKLVGTAQQFIAAEADKATSLDLDRGATEALRQKRNAVLLAAESASQRAYEDARRDYLATSEFVQSTYDVRIVNRKGVQSGFWREDTRRRSSDKMYYLAVEAVDRNGRVGRMDVRSSENNITKSVATWGIRVPKRVFDRVGQDYNDNGVVDQDKVGVKPAGTLDIRWSIETDNEQKITSW